MKTLLKFALLLLASCVGGCASQAPADSCFKTATGLTLPKSISSLKAKTITVVFVGDTYYLKLVAESDISEFLDQHFVASTWASVKQQMTPPKNWVEDLPFWKQEEVEGKSYFSLDRTNASGTVFTSTLSYDQETGFIYFVGAEVRQ